MTGRDLLEAIGAVDEDLLEHCQKEERITAKNKILWFWHGRTYEPIAACVCLLIIFFMGITYRQYNFFNVCDTLVNEDTQGVAASLDVYPLKGMDRLPKTGDWDGSVQGGNGTDGDLSADALNEADQDPRVSSVYDSPKFDYQSDAGSLPDRDTSLSTGDGADAPQKGSENAEILPPADNKLAKDDEPNSTSSNYSRGIKIEAVKKLPKGNTPSKEKPKPDENPHTAEVPSEKNILKENTVIIRGTVKKMQHFHATGKELDVYFSIVSVKVKEVYRADGKGNPQKGKICKVYLPYAEDSMHSGNGVLGRFAEGSEAVFMPYIAGAETGIRAEGRFFAFLDVSDYYFETETAESHLFFKTKNNVLYDTKIYDIPYTGKKVTLDDVENYIRKLLKEIG